MDEEAIIEQLNIERRQDEAERAALSAAAEDEAPEGEAAGTFLTTTLLAAAKDLTDWVVDLIGIGEIPFIGQIPGMLFTIFLVYHLWQSGAFRGGWIRNALAGIGLVIDNLPVLNNLPLATPASWIARKVRRLAK